MTQGITDFKKFIDSDCYFVDKTHLIAHLINDPSEVHLITRPRRFGKTLNLSMIRYFFEAPPPGGSSTDVPPNASLFDGMSITEHPRYPRIHGTVSGYSFELQECEKSFPWEQHASHSILPSR